MEFAVSISIVSVTTIASHVAGYLNQLSIAGIVLYEHLVQFSRIRMLFSLGLASVLFSGLGEKLLPRNKRLGHILRQYGN